MMSRLNLPIVGAYVAILGIGGLLAYIGTLWITQRRRLYLAIVAFILSAAGVCTLSFFLWRPPIADVRIDAPRDAAKADSPWFSVEGTVSPPDATVWLLVHPCSPRRVGQPWWVQPRPIGAGAWKAEIVLGSAREGRGQYFQVIAVASPRPHWADLLHYQSFSVNQQLDHPPALPRSDVVTIWRPQ
ncbi:MAG TPA: hypothetical protein VJZ76_02620 [Thermoanaerobaculia bacterium]|nr:hypothetical protein [Thermoanaerobaculia bacterium]